MRRCLELASKYKGQTTPNPIVGCVIVDKHGETLAEGVHRGPGKDHAEIDALKKIDRRAPGGTLYCNLEPCNHHGRTPPCAPVVRESGVARVVIGIEDPIEGHGGGIEHLRRGGIAVSLGVLRDACERANLPFLMSSIAHRPAITLKAAMTLDGKICTISGQSKWITGEYARADVMRLRHEHEAVLVGVGTVVAEDPWLTARIEGGRNPQRIVLDSKLRTPPSAHLLPKKHGPRTIVACSKDAPEAKEKALVAKGAVVWRVATHRNGTIDVYPLLQTLCEHGITSILVEGGGEVHAYLLERGLFDELVLYIAPKAVGGPAKSWVGGKGVKSLPSAHLLEFIDEPVLLPGGDLRLHARPLNRPRLD